MASSAGASSAGVSSVVASSAGVSSVVASSAGVSSAMASSAGASSAGASVLSLANFSSALSCAFWPGSAFLGLFRVFFSRIPAASRNRETRSVTCAPSLIQY